LIVLIFLNTFFCVYNLDFVVKMSFNNCSDGKTLKSNTIFVNLLLTLMNTFMKNMAEVF